MEPWWCLELQYIFVIVFFTIVYLPEVIHFLFHFIYHLFGERDCDKKSLPPDK